MMNLDNEQFEFANSSVHIVFASMPWNSVGNQRGDVQKSVEPARSR